MEDELASLCVPRTGMTGLTFVNVLPTVEQKFSHWKTQYLRYRIMSQILMPLIQIRGHLENAIPEVSNDTPRINTQA